MTTLLVMRKRGGRRGADWLIHVVETCAPRLPPLSPFMREEARHSEFPIKNIFLNKQK
jgi:hypothetical protein